MREIWRSDDPARHLFESLLIDLHSRGGAKEFQHGAAMRLLDYFPEHSADLIAARLDSFDVNSIRNAVDPGQAWQRRMEINGTWVPQFIKAVAFCPSRKLHPCDPSWFGPHIRFILLVGIN